MRYRFRGLERETGKPVEGHVEALDAESAVNLLSENGYVTESLREDPKPLNLSHEPYARPDVADAIDSALDTASSQIAFDALAERFRGKNVWVIDREKIRRRVAQVVDQVMAQSMTNTPDDMETRRKVAEAIDGLFQDNRNITSKAEEVAKNATSINLSLEKQIARLANFISKAEGVLSTMSSTLRNISIGGAGGYVPRRGRGAGAAQQEEQNAVLAEIFKTNVELLQQLEGRHLPPDDGEGVTIEGAGGESASEAAVDAVAGPSSPEVTGQRAAG